MPFGRRLAAFAALALPHAAFAGEAFTLREVPALASVPPAQLAPRIILFAEPKPGEFADPVTGLIRFDDWDKARPLDRRLLSLHPSYEEPTVSVTINGVTKPYKKKLHVYVAEARFVLQKPPAALDLARYVNLKFVQEADPAIRHKAISAADAVPLKDPEAAFNRHPERRWCEAPGPLACIESHYALEGKLPLGIRLANKLEEGGKKIAESIDFQSELRLLTREEAADPALLKLTGIDAPVAGGIQQTIFHVNQILTFGRLVAVFQPAPGEAGRTVVTVFMALGLKSDVLEKKKEFEKAPVLRNMVPAQVLMGQSSFNTGTSISAGLPKYVRNRIEALAAILERG